MDHKFFEYARQNHEHLSMHFGPGLLAIVLLLSDLSVPMTVGRARSRWQSEQSSVGSSSTTQGDKDVRPLEISKPIERELSGGQAHYYQIILGAGQYIHAIVDQRGIDVVVTLFGPDGKKLIEIDSPNGTHGPESVSWVADTPGSYQLEVRSPDKTAASGRYEAKIEEVRAATPQDKDRIGGQKANAEGAQLEAQGTAESLRKAIDKYTESLTYWHAAGDRRSEADALHSIGALYKSLGEIQKALDSYSRALQIRRAVGDRRGEARTLNNIGLVHKSTGDTQRALDHYSQALALERAVGDPSGEAGTLTNIGGVYWSLGEMKKALDHHNQALSIMRAVGDRVGEATTLSSIGLVYWSLGEMKKALEYQNLALPLQRAVGDRRGEAFTLNNIGGVYWSLGEMDKALDYYSQVLPIQRAVGDRRGEAYALHNIALVYNNLGEKQKALESYNQALPLERAIRDRRGEAQTLNDIGGVYNDLGEKQKALDYLSQALPIRRAVGDSTGEAQTLTNIGLVYNDLGEKQKALDLYNQALLHYRAVGDRRGEAQTLTNIGLVHNDLGEKQKALEYHSQALSLERAIGDRSGEAYTLHNIGAVYNDLGDKLKALDYYNQALPLRRAIGDRTGEARTLNNVGSVYKNLGEKQKALDYYNQALPVTQAVSDHIGEVITRYELARVKRDQANLAEARFQIETALTIIDSLRTKVVSQELRASYFASAHEYYEFYIDLLMELHRLYPMEGHAAIALAVSERARARSMLELLTEARADIRQGVDPALLERERSLQQLLNGKAEYQVRVLSGKHTEEQAKAVAKEIEALTTEYQQVEARIRQVSPRYAALTQPQPLTPQEIQQKLLDADTLLLEYSLGEERSYLWAMTQTSITSYVLPKRSEIEAAARQTYGLLTARQPVPGETFTQRRARVAQADAQYWQQAAALSQILLGPVVSHLGKKRLLIVADGALQYVPFAALPAPMVGDHLSVLGEQVPASMKSRQATRDSQPLIIEHEIVSLPSASVLAALRQETVGRSPAAKAVVVLADPVFEKDDPRVKAARGQAAQPEGQSLTEDLERAIREVGVTDTAGGISRLPFSRHEAEAILAFAPAGEAMKAMDFKASRATATSPELSQYRIVHFATHGLLNSEHPELSGIVLSLIDEQGQPQDGFLRLHEIYNLNLPAELVVLSACRTGLGKEVKGEGLIGITRGFMYAGATRVVASLWRVEDEATAELMKYFYQGMLGKKMRPATGLRAAQVEMRRQKRWQAPYYWASFVLQGEWK